MTDLEQDARKDNAKRPNYHDDGMRVFSDLLTGVLLYGGLGWVGDHFLDTGFLMPAGELLVCPDAVYMGLKRNGSEK